jgi:hypothetical protein
MRTLGKCSSSPSVDELGAVAYSHREVIHSQI